MELSQILPRDQEAEASLVAAMLAEPKIIMDVVPVLGTTGEPFFDKRYGIIYTALVSLDSRNIQADRVVLRDYLSQQPTSAQGITLLSLIGDAIDQLPLAETGYAQQHAQIVRRNWILRRLIYTGGEMARLAAQPNGQELEDVLSAAEQMVYEIRSGQASSGLIDPTAVASEVWRQMERQIADPNYVPGWKTGIVNLDRILGYLEPGRLVTIAGRPGMGKSTMALQLTRDLSVRRQHPTLFFSFEMGEPELLRRMISAETGIEGQRLKAAHRLSNDEVDQVHAAIGAITRAPIQFGKPGGALYMKAIARRWATQTLAEHTNPPAAIMIDYLQLVNGVVATKHTTRDQEIGQITRTLKLLAQELNVVVFMLSQLNREVERRTDHHPMLADLRSSGNIEQDSDVVIFTYAPAMYMSEQERSRYTDGEPYELIVRKWRDGATGTAKCIWHRATGKIVSEEA